MTGDQLKYATEVVGKDPMATFLGIAVDEAREKYARCSVEVKSEYLNAANRAHGSIIHALADQAFAVSCNSFGTGALGMQFNINYIAAADPGERIYAESVPISITNRVSVWDIEVKTADGKLIAAARGTAYHKQPKK